jgi:hypothetical protein
MPLTRRRFVGNTLAVAAASTAPAATARPAEQPATAWWTRNREVMPEAAAPGPAGLAARLARHDLRWPVAEATISNWAAGVPLGNGDFGALLYGPTENLTLLLGKNDLWLRANDQSQFPGKRYADLLEIYRAGDEAAYRALLPQEGDWRRRFRPSTAVNGGFFRLSLAEAGIAHSFEHRLQLEDATWRGSFRAMGLDSMWGETPDHELEAFASAPDEVLVLRVRRRGLSLRSFTWRLGRERHDLLAAATVGAEGPLAWLEQPLLKGDRYAIAVLQAGPTPHLTTGLRTVLGESVPDSEHEVTFYLAAASQRDGDDPRGLACDRVERAARRGRDAIHADHRRHWAADWARSWVSCADADVERTWYLSNYLRGSTVRPGKVSPGLQGMWIKENLPPWGADFHGNVNIQAVYMGLMAANRMECFEPYARLYHEMRPQCRADTRRYFGTDGARYPHGGSIDGYELAEPNWPALAVSIGPSSWIARLFWWAYRHTLDEEFLAEVAYPILADVATFYAGLLELAGKGPDGRYRLEPSIYSEMRADSFAGWGTNSTYDIVCMRNAFQQAADAADVLGRDGDLARRWRGLHGELPDLAVDERDVWVMFPPPRKPEPAVNPGWCYPLFPGEIAGAFHGSTVERRRARATWDVFRERMAGGWCAGCPTAAAALMGDADWALRSATILFQPGSKLAKNGLAGNAAPGQMQAEHGTGLTLALNSMLLLGVEDRLVLFPGMPAAVDAAFHSLRAPGAILVSAEQRGGAVTHAAFQSLRGGPIRVLNPFRPPAGTTTVPLRVEDVRTTAAIARFDVPWREVVEWRAEPGAVYRLAPA